MHISNLDVSARKQLMADAFNKSVDQTFMTNIEEWIEKNEKQFRCNYLLPLNQPTLHNEKAAQKFKESFILFNDPSVRIMMLGFFVALEGKYGYFAEDARIEISIPPKSRFHPERKVRVYAAKTVSLNEKKIVFRALLKAMIGNGMTERVFQRSFRKY